MNGPHDMGGMQCYGPVNPEIDEPLFHADWERAALALTVGMGFAGMWNIDLSRSARETLPPVRYLSSSYYQIWLAALEKLMLERGMVTTGELESGVMQVPPVAVKRVPDAAQMQAALMAGGPSERVAGSPARFDKGDKVQAKNIHPQGHTRLPRYVRGKPGVIEQVNGVHVYPDSNGNGGGEDPQWLYTVRFEARDLFGETADHVVLVDCWEPYLEAR